MQSTTPYMKWQETRQDTARHLKDCFRDTSAKKRFCKTKERRHFKGIGSLGRIPFKRALFRELKRYTSYSFWRFHHQILVTNLRAQRKVKKMLHFFFTNGQNRPACKIIRCFCLTFVIIVLLGTYNTILTISIRKI